MKDILALGILNEAMGKNTGRERTGGTNTCVCPDCGYKTPHKRGIPCNEIECPKCGAKMTGVGTVGSKAKK